MGKSRVRVHFSCIAQSASTILRPRRAPAKRVINELKARFSHQQYSVEFQPTAYAFHGTELARAAAVSGVDLVLACGGDGTVNEVVEGMVDLDDSARNQAQFFCKNVRRPRDPQKVPTALPSWKPLPIALGKCGGRHFILMVGAGFDAAVIDSIDVSVEEAAWTMRVCRYGHSPMEIGPKKMRIKY